MKGAAAMVLATVLLLTLQTSLGGPGGVLGVRPDFLLLLVLWAGMRGGEVAGTGWGVALGWAQDALSAGMPGMNVLTKGLAGFAAGSLRDQLDCDNPNTQAVVAATATVAEGVAQLALLRVVSAAPDLVEPLLGGVLPAAAAHGALLPAAEAAAQAFERARRRRAARAAAA